jgi:hypothetical protein
MPFGRVHPVATGGRFSLARLRERVVRAIKAAALFAAVGLVCGNGYASTAMADNSASREPPAESGWIDWNGDNFFGPCRGDCAFSLYGGKEVTTSMLRIFFLKSPPAPVWRWHWRNSEIVAGTFSRRLVTFWNVLSLEPEFGIGQRFGEMHATEFWGAINIRWTEFPWNHYIKTSIGLSEGISMATKLDTRERLLNNYKIVGNSLAFTGSRMLNFFTPEMTFALPEHESYELLVRFHHRSGAFGSINGVHAGAQFFTTGLRLHF